MQATHEREREMKHDIGSLYTKFILKARKIKTKLIMARSDFELKYLYYYN